MFNASFLKYLFDVRCCLVDLTGEDSTCEKGRHTRKRVEESASVIACKPMFLGDVFLLLVALCL